MTKSKLPASLKSEQNPLMNDHTDRVAIRPLQDREIVHVIAAIRSGFPDPEAYISDVIRRHSLSSAVCDALTRIDYDTSQIDDKFGGDEDLWEQAYDALGCDREIWIFELPANRSDCETVAELRNHNGRPNFFPY